jgi:hypothetical protein
MKRLLASRRFDPKYDAIVDGVVDTIDYQEDLGEWFGTVYSRDLEKDPYNFYQGVVVFEPFSESEIELDLHSGDKVKLGVILSKDDYGYDDDIVDIISKEN